MRQQLRRCKLLTRRVNIKTNEGQEARVHEVERLKVKHQTRCATCAKVIAPGAPCIPLLTPSGYFSQAS